MFSSFFSTPGTPSTITESSPMVAPLEPKESVAPTSPSQNSPISQLDSTLVALTLEDPPSTNEAPTDKPVQRTQPAPNVPAAYTEPNKADL